MRKRMFFLATCHSLSRAVKNRVDASLSHPHDASNFFNPSAVGEAQPTNAHVPDVQLKTRIPERFEVEIGVTVGWRFHDLS